MERKYYFRPILCVFLFVLTFRGIAPALFNHASSKRYEVERRYEMRMNELYRLQQEQDRMMKESEEFREALRQAYYNHLELRERLRQQAKKK